MKNQYVKPEMVLEEFLANKYCVNCAADPSRRGVTINFVCNAGGGDKGGVWKESNGIPGIQSTSVNRNKDDRQSRSISSFSACNKTHEVTVYGVSTVQEALAKQNDMFAGYYKKAKYNWGIMGGSYEEGDDASAISVYVWTDGGTNTHATTLQPEQWTLAKS